MITQDLGCSAGEKWTTKHIGLSSTLHQMTVSESILLQGCITSRRITF